MDKGPWTVGPEDDRIDSGDFTHDASLILYGDFRTRDRRPYLEFIANELNSCSALRSRLELLEKVAEKAKKLVGTRRPMAAMAVTAEFMKYWDGVDESLRALEGADDEQ